MAANISEDELKLLTYLHEHAKGYGPRFGMAPDEIVRAIQIGAEDFNRYIAYLEEHGLVGARTANVTAFGDPPAGSYVTIVVWITGLGEDYMRELEAAPGIARKLTVGTLKELGKVVKDVAVQVLTEHLNSLAKVHLH